MYCASRRRGAQEKPEGHSEMMLLEKSAAGAFAGIVNSPLKQVFERIKAVMQVRNQTELLPRAKGT